LAGNVVHAVTSLKIGGAERFVLDLARVQARAGCTPLILSLSGYGDELCSEARAAGVRFVALRALTIFERLRAIRRTLRSAEQGALHVHSPWCLRVLAPFLPFFPGALIYTRHGAHAYDSWDWKILHAWAHQFASHVTCVSPEALEVHRRTYSPLRVPLHLLEFGVDTEVRKHAPREDGAPIRVGSVGRLVELKGQRFVIDAVAAIRSAPVELHVFGDGPDRSALEAHARQRLPGRAIFHGSVIDRERIYENIDILAVSSRMEGLSLVIMEAMARSIPVVATNVGGNSRLVIPDETGMLVPYADVSAMAYALTRVIVDRSVRQRLADAGRTHVVHQYSLEKAARTLLALYGFERSLVRP
jgi:glycosyltransferase involved in cell wall biosynthesis